jgi:phage terminase small subunit
MSATPAMDALSAQRQAFVRALAAGSTQADAARTAGYASGRARQTAHELLRKPEVKAALDELVAPALEQARVDVGWVLDRSISIVEAGMREEQGGSGRLVDSQGANRSLDRVAKYTGGFVERSEVEHHGDITIVRNTRSTR